MTSTTANYSFLSVKNNATLSSSSVIETLTVTGEMRAVNQNIESDAVTTTLVQLTGPGAEGATLRVGAGSGGSLVVTTDYDNIVCRATTTEVQGGSFTLADGITVTTTFPTKVLDFTNGILTSAITPFGTFTSININTANVSVDSSDDHSFVLPLVATGAYDFAVSWGDGSASAITTYDQPEVTHTYATTGSYVVEITGTLVGWAFNRVGDCLKVTNINSWGKMIIGAAGETGCFAGCSNLTISPAAGSPVSSATTTSLDSCFRDCTSLNSVNVATWDVSAVQTISKMFFGCTAFNINLSSWNTVAVQDMSYLFDGCTSFNNGVLTNSGGVPLTWTTDAVTTTKSMFHNCQAFNQSVVFSNLSLVTDCSSMFASCSLFNNGDVLNAGGRQLDLNFTNHLESANTMFFNATAFNQTITFGAPTRLLYANGMFYCTTPGVSVFNNGNVLNTGTKPFDTPFPAIHDTSRMFYNCAAFNQTVGIFTGSDVHDVSFMFANCDIFNNGNTADAATKPLAVDTPYLTTAASMFQNCFAFNQILTLTDTSQLLTTESMFNGASTFNNGNIANDGSFQIAWTTPVLQTTFQMFMNTPVFNQTVTLSTLNALTTTSQMFAGATLFNNGNVADAGTKPFDLGVTNSLLDASQMFLNCTSFNQTVTCSSFGNNAAGLFENATRFNNGNIGNAGTKPFSINSIAAQTYVNNMFNGCTSFNQIVSFAGLNLVTTTNDMFSGATLFNNGNLANEGTQPMDLSTKTSTLESMSNMFLNCVAFNQTVTLGDLSALITTSGMFLGATLFNNGNAVGVATKSMTFGATSLLIDASEMFAGCASFNQIVSFADLSAVVTINQLFAGATLFNNGDVGNAGTQALTLSTGTALLIAGSVFADCAAFNQVFTLADTTNLIDANSMFLNAVLFNNGELADTGTSPFVSIPTTSALLITDAMFYNATSFNQTVAFSTMTNLQSCVQMFASATLFNNGDVGDLSTKPLSWTAPNLTNTSQMFLDSSAFNQAITLTSMGPILTDVSYMFQQALLFNQRITFDTFFVTSMANMFASAEEFNNGEVGNTGSNPLTLNTTFVTSFDYMFAGAKKFNQQLVFSDTSSVSSFEAMFSTALIFNNGVGVHPLAWNTSAATSFAGMFAAAETFNQQLLFTDTSRVQNMTSMFLVALSFNNGDLANDASASIVWDTGNVTEMKGMFNLCRAFNQELVFSDMSKVTTTQRMFLGCPIFNNGDVADASSKPLTWNLALLENAKSMFFNCHVFNQALHFLNMNNMTEMADALYGCDAFKQNISSWTVKACVDFTGFFIGDMNNPDSTVNQDNHNAMLIAWAAQAPLQPDVRLDMGTTQYSLAVAGAARGILTGTYGWTIYDGGSV